MAGITDAQRRALADLAQRRPVAGNDDGWVDTDGVRWPTLMGLRKAGMVEPESTEIRGGRWLYRLTEAGHAALARPMTGFFATLTPEQRAAVLTYDGPENHGDPEFALGRERSAE